MTDLEILISCYGNTIVKIDKEINNIKEKIKISTGKELDDLRENLLRRISQKIELGKAKIDAISSSSEMKNLIDNFKGVNEKIENNIDEVKKLNEFISNLAEITAAIDAILSVLLTLGLL
jgi:hypothetical protein